MRVLPPFPPSLERQSINPRDLRQYLLEVEEAIKDTLVKSPDMDSIRQMQGMVIVIQELKTKLRV